MHFYSIEFGAKYPSADWRMRRELREQVRAGSIITVLLGLRVGGDIERLAVYYGDKMARGDAAKSAQSLQPGG